MRKTKSSRAQSIPQHRLDVSRQQWTRKPQTQVVTNKKAEQRRTMCRKKGIPDGAVYYIKTGRVPLGDADHAGHGDELHVILLQLRDDLGQRFDRAV
jgi:hypothetical protein